jgi:hypothetical protein
VTPIVWRERHSLRVALVVSGRIDSASRRRGSRFGSRQADEARPPESATCHWSPGAVVSNLPREWLKRAPVTGVSALAARRKFARGSGFTAQERRNLPVGKASREEVSGGAGQNAVRLNSALKSGGRIRLSAYISAESADCCSENGTPARPTAIRSAQE